MAENDIYELTKNSVTEAHRLPGYTSKQISLKKLQSKGCCFSCAVFLLVSFMLLSCDNTDCWLSLLNKP